MRSAEEKQLIWFFLIIAVVFGSFLIPYFYIQELNKFDFVGIEWVTEPFGDSKIYHGRFYAFDGSDVVFNVYMRNDPRKNDIPAEGNFNLFVKDESFITLGAEARTCNGRQVSRALVDLGSFLKAGVGVESLDVGTTDLKYSKDSGIKHVDCLTHPEKTVIRIEKGEESWIVQDKENPYCYIIQVNSCEDIAPIEKFMVEAISDFKETGISNQ